MLRNLLNKKMKLLKNQQGLTLIELLVVIVILGIIAAIAIPMVMGNQDEANKNTNLQNVKILQDAVNRYEVLNSVAPTKTEGLAQLLVEENNDVPKGGPFLDAIPTVQGCGETTAFEYDGDTVSIPKGCPGGAKATP